MQPPANQPTSQPNAGDDETVVEFFKGRHLWRFRCLRGDEERLVDSIARLAAGGKAPLDWFDAAVLSEEILGRNASISKLSTLDHLPSMQTSFDLPETER